MNIRLAAAADIDWLNIHDPHIARRELKESVRAKRIYLAEAGGTVCGWLRYNLFWDNTPFMNMLYILEEFRGCGYGSALAERWEADMRRLGYSALMTSTQQDETAQHFYQKLGYRGIGGFLTGKEPMELILYKEIA